VFRVVAGELEGHHVERVVGAGLGEGPPGLRGGEEHGGAEAGEDGGGGGGAGEVVRDDGHGATLRPDLGHPHRGHPWTSARPAQGLP
jgi:hypothetical protein